MVFEDKLVSKKELISVKKKRSQTHILEKFEPVLQEIRESEGWVVDKALTKHIRMKKPKPMDEQFEDEVWLLCAALGFTHLNSDRHLELPYGAPETNTTKQIDVLAIDDETVLVIECKCARTGKRGNFKDDIEALYGIREGLSKTIKKGFPKRKIKCIFATKNYEVSEADCNRMKALKIQHFDHVAIKYFADLAKHLGKSARFQLLGHLFAGTTINSLDNRIPAIKGKMGGYTYYSFSIEPDKLLKIAYVLHHNDANEEMMPTYQRIIKKNRLNEIQNFVNKGGFFPNSIIINIDTGGKELRFDISSLQVESSVAQLGILYLPSKYRTAYIIDGQHRLYGYADSKYCSTSSLPVVAFVNLKQEKQVELFMEINENQKTVSKNLKNTLNADLLWSSEDLNEQRKALRLSITQKLGDKVSSPLYERVIIGENERTVTRCISMDAIESSLKMTNFFSRFSNDNLIIANGTFDKGNNEATQKNVVYFLIRCFDFFREALPEEWLKGDKGCLAINNTIHSLIRLFNDIINHLYLNKEINPQIDNPDDVADKVEYYLDPLITYFRSITEDEWKVIRTSYGSGGKSKVWRIFQTVIADARPDFKPDGLDQWKRDNTKKFNSDALSMIQDIQTTIRGDFANKLQAKYGEKWMINALPQKVHQQASLIMAKESYEGHEVSLWDCVAIANFKDIATFGQNWSELFEKDYTRPEELKMPGGKAAKTEWILRLSKIATSISSASYSVAEQDYLFLKSLHEWLIR